MIIEHPNVQCNTCGQTHPKKIRFNANGRLYVPKPRSLLAQMAEPPCIQSMWKLNGLHWRRTRRYDMRPSIESWLDDIFLQETPPKLIIEHVRRDWRYYEDYASAFIHRLLKHKPLNVALHAVDHLFPTDVEVPEETLRHLVYELWPRSRRYSNIITARGFDRQAFEEWEPQEQCYNPPQIAIIERLWERHGAPVASAIVRNIALPSTLIYNPILWDTANYACYFIRQFVRRGELAAAKQLLEIMIHECRYDASMPTQAMREFMQAVFDGVIELQPLVDALKNPPDD